MKKFFLILLNAIPIFLMIGIIPLVPDDYVLTVIYIAITAVSLLIKKSKHDILLFVIGFVAMFGAEYLFISTGVGTFHRKSLFGIMPLWLLFLWGYSFIAIKRLITLALAVSGILPGTSLMTNSWKESSLCAIET